MGNNENLKIFKWILALPFWAITTAAFSDPNEKQFGRYLTNNQEQPSLISVLDMPIQREFPKSVETIGEAIEYTLKGTGYQLLSAEHCTPDVQKLYDYKVPLINRKIPPTSLKEALVTLTGQAYQIVFDPIHRQITFKLRRDYQNL